MMRVRRTGAKRGRSPTWYVQASEPAEKEALKAGLLEDVSPGWRYPYVLAWGLRSKEAAVEMMAQLAPKVKEMAEEAMERKNGRVILGRIRPSRWQPRQAFDPDELWELAKSIKENDLINPVVVFPVDGGYELVAGERRTRAAMGLALGEIVAADGLVSRHGGPRLENLTPKEYVQRLAAVGLGGLTDVEREYLQDATARTSIRARVLDAPAGEEDLEKLHRLAIVENLERANLSPLEEARGLQGLVEAYGWSQRELARHLGKSQGWVAQRLGILQLPQAAQEAVSTRVLSVTHARALQGVPEAVAPAVIEHVKTRVADGASTREVTSIVNHFETFLHAERYAPAPDEVVEPKSRNRLAMLRWLVETTDWATKADNLVALKKHHWISGSAKNQIMPHYLGPVTRACGYADIEDAWDAFAAETGRLCVDCVWGSEPGLAQVAGTWEGKTYMISPCELMRDEEACTCDGFIGEDDPQIVELGYETKRAFERLEIPYEEEPFSHVEGIGRYIAGYVKMIESRDAWEAEQDQNKALAHVKEIERYWEWQLDQPLEATEHIRAHGCTKCVHFTNRHITRWTQDYVEKTGRVPPPCVLAENPLTRDWHGRRGIRAPEFGAFVTQDGRMLPRCEAFAYRTRPRIQRVPGVVLPNREQVVGWLRSLAGRSDGSHYLVWRPLQWLDMGHIPGEGDKAYRGLMVDYVLTLWGMPGNRTFDEAIPTLLDVAASEGNPQVLGSAVIELVNPVTAERERFMAVGFDVATGERTFPGYRNYPDGWPKPWLNRGEGDGEDDG